MEKEKILAKLADVKEKLDILEKNIGLLGLRMALEDAATLRENLCKDNDITEACDNDSDISAERKMILDSIRAFQVDHIAKSINRETEENSSQENITDYKKAKSELSQVIDRELKDNLFGDEENSPIFGQIEKCKEHTDTLNRVRKNCEDDKYIVLLIGEYQTGKSTTIDALCDGHHISAIGDGTATSAVPVSVTYAPKESINIRWKNKEQLSLILSKIKIFFPYFDWGTFDLDSQKSREALTQAIEEVRKSDICPKPGNGDAKFLMVSDLLLKYYASEELNQKKKTLQHVSEISNFTRFPKKGETLWMKSGVSAFGIDKAMFVFMDCVECYIPSETLRLMNCTFIDTPGLFNSSYDTMITQNAMIAAHAIMYILPRHKGIGEDNCNSLYYIKKNYSDIHSKLFIVNNLDSTMANEFFSSNCETIKAMFGDEKEVYRYDALLSYLIQEKKSYAKGELKESEYSHLMEVSVKSFMGGEKTISFNNFGEALEYHADKYSRSPLIDISGTPEEALYECGFSSMISALESFVTKNRAHAIIVSNGINPMYSELTSVNSSLYRQFVEPYSSSYDEIVRKWAERISKAEKFQIYMSSIIKDTLYAGDSASLLERITDEEYRKLFTDDYFQQLAEAIARVLYDNKGALLATKTLFKKNKELFKKRFMELATPWIKEAILSLLTEKISYMDGIIDRNQDPIITNLFKPEVEKAELQLKNHWKEEFAGEKDFEMSNYVTVKNNLSGVWSDSVDCNSYNTGNLTNGFVDLTLVGGLVAHVAVAVTGIASMIAGYITMVFCDPSGATLLTALGLGATGLVISAFAPDYVRDKFVRPLAKQIRPQLISEGGIGFKDIIRGKLNEAFDRYATGISVNINKMKNERDIALTPQTDQEALCFDAVDAMISINNQLNIYDEYKKANIFRQHN